MVFGTNSNKLLQEIRLKMVIYCSKAICSFTMHAATFQFCMCLLGNWLLAALLIIKDLGKKPI